MSGRQVVFIGDEEDDADLALVWRHLERLGILGRRVHPKRLTFIGDAAGVRVWEGAVPLSADLVVGWVFETWLSPGALILDSLALAGHRVLNTGATLRRGQNKVATSMALAAAGVPHGTTLTSFDAEGLAVAAPEGDWVVKPGFVDCGGISVCTSGKGVVRVSGPSALAAQQETLASFGQPLYAQSYFARERNSDLRVWLFGNGRYEAVRKVPRQGEWITNTGRGVTLEKFTPDAACMEVAARAAKAVGAQIAGLDMAETEAGYRVIEVNTCPTFLPAVSLLGETVPMLWADFLAQVLDDPDWNLS